MAEWNHRICERCWFDGEQRLEASKAGEELPPPLGMLDDGSYRRPVQAPDAEPGACCFCGGMTITGIYVRRDEQTLPCRGRHEDPSEWSRVQLGPPPALTPEQEQVEAELTAAHRDELVAGLEEEQPQP